MVSEVLEQEQVSEGNEQVCTLNLHGLKYKEMAKKVFKLFHDIEGTPGLFEEILNKCPVETEKYSQRNRILVQLQHPGAHTLHTKEGWNYLGRHQTKGSKAIYIRIAAKPSKEEIKNGAKPGKPIFRFKPLYCVQDTTHFENKVTEY